MKKTILTIAILFSLATILTHAQTADNVKYDPPTITGLDDRFETHVLVKSTAISTLENGMLEHKYLRSFINKRTGEVELTQVYVGFYHYENEYRFYDEAIMVGGYQAKILSLEKFPYDDALYEGYGIELYESELLASVDQGLAMKLKANGIRHTVVELSPTLFIEHLQQLVIVRGHIIDMD